MNIVLKRFSSGSDDTLGLMHIDGKFAAFTLEDEARTIKVAGETHLSDRDWETMFI